MPLLFLPGKGQQVLDNGGNSVRFGPDHVQKLSVFRVFVRAAEHDVGAIHNSIYGVVDFVPDTGGEFTDGRQGGRVDYFRFGFPPIGRCAEHFGNCIKK